jgi:hypothetical protein
MPLIQVSEKKKLSADEIQRRKDALAKGRETRAKYLKIRKELGLKAKDPIPDKYLDPKSEGYKEKEYDPEPAESREVTKDIPDEERAELVKESKAKRAPKVIPEKQAMSAREMELKKQLKMEEVSRVVRQEIEDALFRRSEYKRMMKPPKDDPKDEPPKEQKIEREPEPPKRLRVRGADGRIREY